MTFTASNGITVDSESQAITGYRRIKFVGPQESDTFELSGRNMRALIEALDHERDEELGRWRWPENPDYVVYPMAAQARVVDERTGREHLFGRVNNSGDWAMADAAEAYFEAHPERMPWEDAKDGEAWLVECAGTPKGGEPFVVHLGKFKSPTTVSLIAKNDPTITAARRIWPEPDRG